jgi:16S rRNA (guanine527-N7)-methyltransferase
LAIAAKFKLTKEMQVMDLGCGGGFPGIPLAILFPDTNFHLVDSINKKLKVVTAISEAIGLSNITTQHARAEEIKNRKFDLVVSRAVAPLKDLWRWSKPVIRKNNNREAPNGLICLKGGDLTTEIFESGCKPMVWEIEKIFHTGFFTQKYILYIPFTK